MEGRENAEPQESGQSSEAVVRLRPKSKHYKETQFSTIKYRHGRESVPFLGLSPGTHQVKFVDGDKSKLCLVKVWISLYGDAWQIIKDI